MVPAVAASRTPPPNAYAHPSCYARALNECSAKLTREHYISHALLLYLEQHDALHLKGFPWQTDTTPRLTARVLQSKILCERHNGQLSPLDAVALKFFRAFSESSGGVRVFNGHEVERMLLKMLVGLTFAGAVRRADGAAPTPDAGSAWIKLLFSGSPMPTPCGLYFLHDVGDRIERPAKPRISLASLWTGNEVGGITVEFSGFQFSLALRAPARDDRHFGGTAHRPSRIAMRNLGGDQEVELAW